MCQNYIRAHSENTKFESCQQAALLFAAWGGDKVTVNTF
jgi:hypothetical protein